MKMTRHIATEPDVTLCGKAQNSVDNVTTSTFVDEHTCQDCLKVMRDREATVQRVQRILTAFDGV